MAFDRRVQGRRFPTALGIALEHGCRIKADDLHQCLGRLFGEIARAGSALENSQHRFQPSKQQPFVHRVDIEPAEPALDRLSARHDRAFRQRLQL